MHRAFVFVFLLVVVFVQYVTVSFSSPSNQQTLDPPNTIIFGPGLVPELVFPARYFYIQAVDMQLNNFTVSPGDVFSVVITGVESLCRTWTQVLDRHDGSFIVRYKLFQTCSGLRITITSNNEPVAQSPYLLEGPVYDEQCYCPIDALDDWREIVSCPGTYDQIDDDLSNFPAEIDMKTAVKEAKEEFRHAGSYSLCHYAVVDNKIHRECIGEHVGFKMFMDALLLSLTRKARLPDVEFLVNLGDWPLQKKRGPSKKPIPIFSWCKSDDHADIVMPTYDLTESTLEAMGRVMLDMMTIQSNTGPPWENKTHKAFWRGRDSRRERLELVALARRNPDLMDAALTNFFFFRDLQEEYGPTVKHISFFDFFKFKFQINIDGTVAAYRFPYLLAGDSVVLKQDSAYYEHFYKQLQPWVHYIPFQKDLSDLVEQIQWAVDNDEKAKEIAQNGQQFARDNLMPKDVFCYNAILIQKFSERLKDKPQVTKMMELVPQPEVEPQCFCQRRVLTRDEL